MIIEKLNSSPSNKKCKIFILTGLVIRFIVIPIMQHYSNLSGFPAEFISSQLSFNGDVLKSYYAQTNIDYYRISPMLDYFFMFGYGISIFSAILLISRKYENQQFKKIGNFMALGAVIAAICDGIENIFILIMIADISGFPNVLALLFSTFALIKWILLFTSMIWMILMGFFILYKKKIENVATIWNLVKERELFAQ